MTNPITLYLADDHPTIIGGLKLLVSSNPAIKVLGYGTTIEQARRDILNWRPDLTLIDLRMPGPELNGLELIYELKKKVSTKFIIFSMHHEQRYMRDAMNGGACGYLLKTAGQEELQRCLSAVIRGEQYFPDLKRKKELQDGKSPFTPRETEVLKLVIENYSTAQIASLLSMAQGTVDTHRKNICRKTNASNPLGFLKYLEEHSIEL